MVPGEALSAPTQKWRPPTKQKKQPYFHFYHYLFVENLKNIPVDFNDSGLFL